MIEPSDLLFVGIGKSAVMWYRCALPALALGADWVGVHDEPPDVKVVTGLVRGRTVIPTYSDYKVVVIQQPHGRKWLHMIRSLQDRGIVVLYEVDDYLHGVRKQADHDFAHHFTRERLAEFELCMRVCDGMICSTEWLGRRYRKFNRNVFVCENGLDTSRYELTRPERPTVNIGWAGATGHTKSLSEWLGAVAAVMEARPDTCFVAIGQEQVAAPLRETFGPSRAIGIPFTLIDTYPAAMTLMDIALAPAGNTDWYKAKSDLRWLEAGALGTPIIASPLVYPRIEHGVNGFHAVSAQEVFALLVRLIDDADERRRVGEAVRAYARVERDIRAMAPTWLEIARTAAESASDKGHDSNLRGRRVSGRS